MADSKIQFSAFTKPWREESVDELAALIRGFGFDGIEFPLREGYQLEPAGAEKGLPRLAAQLRGHGLRIFSVASELNESVFSGCAEAGVPMIRIMADIDTEAGYTRSEAKLRERLERIVPLCEKYGVRVGVQQHYGNCIIDASGLMRLVGGFDPQFVGGVWDAAHDALAGQQPEFGLDILWSHLGMVNLKNAYYYRTNGPEADEAKWERYFTTGRHGLASWPRAIEYLQLRGYEGVVCLTAQYNEQHLANRYLPEDLAYAKSLFAGSGR